MEKKELLTESLHILVICNFALSQPLFDLLAKNSEFFVARRSEPLDVFTFVLFLVFILPSLLILTEMILLRCGGKVRNIFHIFVIAILFSLITMPFINKTLRLSAYWHIPLSVLLGTIGTILYSRFAVCRRFITCLAPAVILFPCLFFFHGSVQKILFPAQPLSKAVNFQNPPPESPVIMIILDELPLTVLLNGQFEIDADRFPHFSSLAETSLWFRNASTVADATHLAIPAILSGNYPDFTKLPTRSDHPDNLFTLFQNSHRLHIYESITQLSPEENKTKADYTLRMKHFFTDAAVVFAHIILSQDMRKYLPDISHGWGNFTGPGKGKKSAFDDALEKLRTDRKAKFYTFLNEMGISDDRPGLHFLHILLPHAPFTYLPSGKMYGSDTGLEGCISEKWVNDERLVNHSFQRYLLQVGFTDTLIGELIGKLKEKKIFDSSLIVITADHGVSFRKNDFRRPITETNYRDIMPVPLFIKKPFQHSGEIIDRNTENIDILATVADILDIRIPWETDGHSALDNSIPEKKEKFIFSAAKEKRVYDSDFKFDKDAIQKTAALTNKKLYPKGPFENLLGLDSESRPLLSATENAEIKLAIDEPASFHIPENSDYVPVYVKGTLQFPENMQTEPAIAIAVNGKIRATAQSYATEKGQSRFAAILPEDSLRKKQNRIAVFGVSEDDEDITITKLPYHTPLSYSLVFDNEKKEMIVSSENTSVPIEKDYLQGHLEMSETGDRIIEFGGWAVDNVNGRLPESIVIFVNGESVYTGNFNQERADIAKAKNTEVFYKSGFKYLLPRSVFRDLSKSDIRFYALSESGVASELNYHPGYKWRQQRQDEQERPHKTEYLSAADSAFIYDGKNGKRAIHFCEGKTFAVIPEVLKGHLDFIEIKNDMVEFGGWAADTENKRIPESVLIFSEGKAVYRGDFNRERPDIARAFSNPAFLRSGFHYRLPLSLFHYFSGNDVRFFALSENHIAGELNYPPEYKW